jgi:hypothetical protein
MQLQKATNNTNIALTLQEKVTLTSPYFLFEFQNDTSLVKYYQIFTDISTAGPQRNRANLFDIEVVASGAGAEQIVLGNVGQYNYTIYEQTSDSNLDPDDGTVAGIVERGRMRLIDTETSIYIEHDIDVNYIIYEQ